MKAKNKTKSKEDIRRKPLKLDMTFEEAMQRMVRVKPEHKTKKK